MESTNEAGEWAIALQKSASKQVRDVCKILNDAGFRSWIVGGSVRDAVMATISEREPKTVGDWDLATNARPEQVSRLFRNVIPTGIAHGTVTVVLGKQHFEITTLRGERGHSDGRRPDEIFFVDDLREDLARRDFTVNAMAYSLIDDTFTDPFDGATDLKRGLLRAVGNPAQRFSEDGLRVLRCARFCATLGLDVEENTRRAILPSLSSFTKVARERVADEWFKALRSDTPSRFFRVVRDEGMLKITAPHLYSTSDTLLAFDQMLSRIDGAPANPVLRLAFFLRAGTPNDVSPEQAARDFARELRLSKEQSTALVTLCSHALLPDNVVTDASGYGGRKWLSQVGRERAPDVLTIQKLVCAESASATILAEAHENLLRELDSGCPLSLKELAVSGADLMKDAGLPKGPELGTTLMQLLEATLENPAQNERALLLRLATRA